MAATAEDIRGWLKKKTDKGQVVTHVLIVCDTFDYEDFPIYVTVNEDVRKVYAANHGPNMQKVMEVYDLTESEKPIATQLAEHRSFNYGRKLSEAEMAKWIASREKRAKT